MPHFPPPPPDCKVLGRLAAASALTLAAAVGGAIPAQAAPLPDPPCTAATHFEAPAPGGSKCIPKSGDVFETQAEGEALCAVLGGNTADFSSFGFGVVCENDYINKPAGGAGRCFFSRNPMCLARFNTIRDCNAANQKANLDGANSVVSCAAAACGSGQQAVGGTCRDKAAAIICTGDEVPNEAGDACVCPTAAPYADDNNCVAACQPGNFPNAEGACESCEAGHYNADGLGDCDVCFPPATASQTNPSRSPLAGLFIFEGEACRNTGECLHQSQQDNLIAEAALELCGPNAACVDLDPRDNPNDFTVGEWRYKCECNEGFSDSDQGDHERKLDCSGTGARTVEISASPGGAVSSTPPAGELDFETEVVFTATPDLGFMVSAWVGADEWVRSGNCDAGATRCEVTVTRAVTVGALFEDVDECAAGSDGCPADSSCRNLDAAAGGGRFECDCNDASLDFAGGVCTGAREVAILASSGGAVSAVVSGDGTVIETKGDVAHGATVVLRATPVAGARVSVWLGVSGVGECAARAAECVVTVTRDVEVGAVFEDVDECASAADDCPSASSSCRNLDAVSGGGRFACDCDESLYEFDEAARSCGCATAGHLLFGEGGSRECKSPVICPAGYGDANFDCVEDEAAPLTSSQVESIVLCEAFGGLREAVPDSAHPGVCSEVDINDTFCFLEAGEALSCRGLFEHVRDCNALNRPALDPWHCAAACGDKQARGRRCETVTR